MTKLITKYALLALLVVAACSCSHKKDAAEADKPQTPQALYAQAYKLLEEKDYKKAAEMFSKITYEFPYYSGVSKAHLMEIYAYYLKQEYDDVIIAVDNYVKTYPVSKDLPYAYYMKAMASYDKMGTPYRDTGTAEAAKESFNDLLVRFPESRYAADAKIKLKIIDDFLAAHEMIVGRYYLEKGEVLSAINRFKEVVQLYPNSSQAEEALYRLTEAYGFLGMKEETKKHADLLASKYPNSQWRGEATASGSAASAKR